MLVVFSLCGVVFLIISVRELLRRIVRCRSFVRTEGLIVGMQNRTLRVKGRGRTKPTVMHFPEIRFTKPDGESVTFTSEMGDSGPVSRYARGERIKIVYDPEGAVPPMIDSWAGMWLPNLMGVLAGFGFLAGAYLGYWAFWLQKGGP